ncbi:MAG: DUF4124 domain-containing protein [Pseudomonadales bacterium]
MDGRILVQLQRCGWLALVLVACSAPVAAQESYKPLFSQDVLRAADPDSRARLEALNERNRQRWLQQQAEEAGSAPQPEPTRAAQSRAQSQLRAQSAPVTPGKLYRVTDAQGNVRFSDQYVAGAKEVSVSVTEPSAQSRAEHAARQQEQAVALEYFEDRNRRRASEQAEAKRRQTQAAEHKKSCHDLFLEIQDNRRGGFVSYDVDADGERTYLSDAELAARTAGMEADYREHCGELPAIGR